MKDYVLNKCKKESGHSNTNNKDGNSKGNPSSPANKWVIHLSNTPLTEAQLTPLAHGTNFTVAPRNPHYLEYIKAIEEVCHRCNQ